MLVNQINSNSYFKCSRWWLQWCHNLTIIRISSKCKCFSKCNKWSWWCKIWWPIICHHHLKTLNNKMSNSNSSSRTHKHSKLRSQILKTTCFLIYLKLLHIKILMISQFSLANHNNSNNYSVSHLLIKIMVSIHLETPPSHKWTLRAKTKAFKILEVMQTKISTTITPQTIHSICLIDEITYY